VSRLRTAPVSDSDLANDWSVRDMASDVSGAWSGLSEAEVHARQATGQSNAPGHSTSRTYAEIVRANVFTFINFVLCGLGIALVALGRVSDAVLSIGVVGVNLAVGLIQEVHAKHVLDRIAILTRPLVTVIRDGRESRVDLGDIVLGDLVLARPGDQIVADGTMLGDRPVDLDESLLSGESDLVSKHPGDRVYAGSFCVSGTLRYEAQKVGADSLANQLAAGARAFRRVLTPLQHEINRVVRVSVVLVVVFEVLSAIAALLDGTPIVESVRMAVVIAGLIPNGLFLAIAVAYALGAVRLAGRGALVQQANAVESLSHVDVLCLDKTGTLTTNRFQLVRMLPLGIGEPELRQLLGVYASSSSDSNRTLATLRQALRAERRVVVEEVPFSSARKWSGLVVTGPAGPAAYVLGAPDVLAPSLADEFRLPIEADAWAKEGLRVVLFASGPGSRSLLDADGEPRLPQALVPLGVVCFSDELRPDARETLAGFAEAGIQLKLLSGDDARTVRALAIQAGMPAEAHLVSGAELDGLDAAQQADLAAQGTIFGRLTPAQKELLVQSLRLQGRYVAMIGDGVNDVLALKRADLAIAMQTGSAAARAVADLVLLKDTFAALPLAFREGQRIQGGMHAILKLFLTRVLYLALLIVALAVVDAGFPLAPKHNALLTLLTVGIPTLALAAWARPIEPRGRPDSLFGFVLPAACTMAITGMCVYLGYLLLGQLLEGRALADVLMLSTGRSVAQTALTTVSVFCGLLLILFVQPPPTSAEGSRTDRWRPAALAAVLLIAFTVVMLDPRLRALFELAPLSSADFVLLGVVAAGWSLLLHWTWRVQLLGRLLGTDS
jgi:cation-transporting P-type ATPase E